MKWIKFGLAAAVIMSLSVFVAQEIAGDSVSVTAESKPVKTEPGEG
ncbi:hypothetical protein [Kroppenstedtia eburnea]|nr:hypothetical protein [Kroppenstedtia eburnea]QKI83255.1 hypothetical protein GXN75_15375 [Kroppenstedtia eburnea]